MEKSHLPEEKMAVKEKQEKKRRLGRGRKDEQIEAGQKERE